jgi:hypothetical protein
MEQLSASLSLTRMPFGNDMLSTLDFGWGGSTLRSGFGRSRRQAYAFTCGNHMLSVAGLGGADSPSWVQGLIDVGAILYALCEYQNFD